MSVESLIQAGQKGYANIHDNDFYFSDSNFKEIGENEELTKFFMKQVDPDGSKYGGDVEKAKTGFLNDYTFKSITRKKRNSRRTSFSVCTIQLPTV